MTRKLKKITISLIKTDETSRHLSMRILGRIFSLPLIFLVKIYQWVISPLFPPACRYTPTCSQYMLEALRIWGPFKGTWLGIKRIASCRPGGGHGHDPVPTRD